MSISFGTIAMFVVCAGGALGALGLGLLRAFGMKDPDYVGEISAGKRCELCEQSTVETTEDGRLSCYGCGHVSAAPSS